MLPLITILLLSDAKGEMHAVTTQLRLEGAAKGGELTLSRAGFPNSPYVSITNRPGDSAEIVCAKLAEQIALSPVCGEVFGGRPNAFDAQLEFIGSQVFVLGGYEAGLNIPPPPMSVSASWQADNVNIAWVNPAQNRYDEIVIVSGDREIRLGGSVSNASYKPAPNLGESSVQNVVFSVLGRAKGTPSNGSTIRLGASDRISVLMNAPFTDGLCPSFSRWTHERAMGRELLTQGNHPGMKSDTKVSTFRGGGFYQGITGSGTFCGGVARRFLGLNLGHRYRIRARMNTLATKSGDWSFTLNASPNKATIADLTAVQMAGVAELPNNIEGAAAGLIAKFDSTKLTDGKWVECASGPSKDGKTTSDIFLPVGGGTSITIWFRFEGKDMLDCAVGLDSVSIEDLGEQQSEKPKN